MAIYTNTSTVKKIGSHTISEILGIPENGEIKERHWSHL